jgi:hypothetical protein
VRRLLPKEKKYDFFFRSWHYHEKNKPKKSEESGCDQLLGNEYNRQAVTQ